MMTLLKQATRVGLGVARRAQEVCDRLAQEGDAHPGDGAKKIRAFVETAEKSGAEFFQKVDDLKRRLHCHIPTRDDLDRLERKIDALTRERQTGA